MSDHGVKPRKYVSAKRDEAARETRRRIRSRASELFELDGYAMTSMAAVAKAAGVSERTVFIAFPTKGALLSECIRVAVRGGDEDTPMLERPTWTKALNAPADEIFHGLAVASADLMSRAARLLAVGESAGTEDESLVEARRRGRAATRADALEVAKLLKKRGAIRRGITTAKAADIFYGLAASESLYLRLVDHCNWTPTQYARFLERALRGALL
jgi:AcrR family transcriptional regulator